MQSLCPICTGVINGAFPSSCPHCPFTIDALAGRGTTSFQRTKWKQHSDVLAGREIQFYRKPMNASFDTRGYAMLDDLVRYTLTYGDRASLPARGGHTNQVIVSFIPEPIGSGTIMYQAGSIACSGICLVSPQSVGYAHSFPVLGPWVELHFSGEGAGCRICAAMTSFAQPVCASCYANIDGNWRTLL